MTSFSTLLAVYKPKPIPMPPHSAALLDALKVNLYKARTRPAEPKVPQPQTIPTKVAQLDRARIARMRAATQGEYALADAVVTRLEAELKADGVALNSLPRRRGPHSRSRKGDGAMPPAEYAALEAAVAAEAGGAK